MHFTETKRALILIVIGFVVVDLTGFILGRTGIAVLFLGFLDPRN